MSETLSQLLLGLLLFTAVITFFSGLIMSVGEVYYATPPVAGLSSLSSSNDANTQVISPFVSSTQGSEMVGTGANLPYAAIPQMLGAMRSFFKLPTVLSSLMTKIGLYVPLPDWLTSYLFQAVTLIVALGVAVALLNREI